MPSGRLPDGDDRDRCGRGRRVRPPSRCARTDPYYGLAPRVVRGELQFASLVLNPVVPAFEEISPVRSSGSPAFARSLAGREGRHPRDGDRQRGTPTRTGPAAAYPT